MIKVFDFKCTNGHIFEEFVDSTVTTSRCGCGANAPRIASATSFILDGSTGDFPGRHIKWIKEHEEAGQKGREARKSQSLI